MIHYHKLSPAQNTFSDDIARHSGDDVRVYKTVGDEPLRIALYYPPGYDPKNRYPLLVLVHGGGWQSRQVFEDQPCWSGDHLGFLARRYAEQGYLCASIDYRMMRENGQAQGYELIDLCDDCQEAVAYLKEHADEMGVDLERTAVLGESAGGYLAAAMVTLPWMDRDFFKAAIIVNGITDLTTPYWCTRLCPTSAHPRLKGLSFEEQKILMSCTSHITKDTCPTLLMHGTKDGAVPFFHSQKVHDLLQFADVPVRLDIMEDTNHAFLLAEYYQKLGKPLDALDIARQCMDEWLHEQHFMKG